MKEEQMKQIMFATVYTTVQKLTDLELAVLNIVVQTNQDPHGRIFDYKKVAALFGDGGTVHQETKAALAAVVSKRLGG